MFLISISIDCVTFELDIQFFPSGFANSQKKDTVHPIKWGQYLNYLSNLQPINILYYIWFDSLDFKQQKWQKKSLIIFMTSNK